MNGVHKVTTVPATNRLDTDPLLATQPARERIWPRHGWPGYRSARIRRAYALDPDRLLNWGSTTTSQVPR